MRYPLVILITSVLVLALTAVLRAVASGPREDSDDGTFVPLISAKAVEKLAYAGGSDQEIADRFQVDVAFLRRRYSGVMRVARALRKLSIRGWQLDLARKLNGPMLMWLGRNELKQSNSPTEHGEPMPEVEE